MGWAPGPGLAEGPAIAQSKESISIFFTSRIECMHLLDVNGGVMGVVGG
jgi:hypothetical protein